MVWGGLGGCGLYTTYKYTFFFCEGGLGGLVGDWGGVEYKDLGWGY